jgi:hypothetical protein
VGTSGEILLYECIQFKPSRYFGNAKQTLFSSRVRSLSPRTGNVSWQGWVCGLAVRRGRAMRWLARADSRTDHACLTTQGNERTSPDMVIDLHERHRVKIRGGVKRKTAWVSLDKREVLRFQTNSACAVASPHERSKTPRQTSAVRSIVTARVERRPVVF